MNSHGAYILARYSTDNQNPDSIEVQVEKCTEWCAEHNLPVLDVFADYAISGMKDTRPQYDRMIQQLKRGGADTVVIYDQSRMFRKLTAWFSFREELERMGVRVVSVTQPMIGGDLRDPTNFLTEGSMALFNQIWSLQTRQKVVEKMRFMAKNGQHTGGVPALGYKVVDGHLEICEEEAKIVRRIFHAYASGESYRQIIDALNADGLRTRAGNPFGTNSLHDLLKNEKYIGVLYYGATKKSPTGKRTAHSGIAPDAIRIDGGCPRIIDDETWNRVRDKMEKNKKGQAGRPPLRDYPLKGKVFCGECGSSMVVTRSQYKYYYYGCARKQRDRTCDASKIGAPKLERLVADAVRGLFCRPGNIDGLIEVLRCERSRILGDAPDRLRTMIATRESITKKLDAATNAILSGLNSDTLRKKIEELEAEQHRIDIAMEQLKADVDAAGLSDDAIRAGLDEIISRASGDDDAIFSVVARVEVFRDHILIWTLLDSHFDGKVDFREAGTMLNISGNEWLDSDGELLYIDGAALPAPRIIINSKLAVLRVSR